MNYNRIKDLAEKMNIPIRKVIEEMGVSVAGYYKMIENKTLTVENLEKISKILDVEPVYFFKEDLYVNDEIKDSFNHIKDSQLNYNKNFFSKEEQKYKDDNTRLMHENALLRQEVSKLKDKIIELLEKK